MYRSNTKESSSRLGDPVIISGNAIIETVREDLTARNLAQATYVLLFTKFFLVISITIATDSYAPMGEGSRNSISNENIQNENKIVS